MLMWWLSCLDHISGGAGISFAAEPEGGQDGEQE